MESINQSALASPLLKVKDLKMHFQIPGEVFGAEPQTLKAVDGVSFEIHEGETLGIVGESGCGKSTLGRTIMHLYEPTEGEVFWRGERIGKHQKARQKLFREIAMIFQDPLASLNPRMTIREIVEEPLRIHEPTLNAEARREKAEKMLDHVGINRRMSNRYPHEFSGGQCQRIGIARSMILRPKLIVCDEPVSALDVSIQAQVVNLLKDLQSEFGLSLIFISHDLSVVRHIADRVLVLYLGKPMLLSDVESTYTLRNHPYARALISAAPIPNPEEEKARTPVILKGDLPSPIDPPKGCVFSTRCPMSRQKCLGEEPSFEPTGVKNELSACWFKDSIEI